MSDFGPYFASPAAPKHRQPCTCGRPITQDGRSFPHKRDEYRCSQWETHGPESLDTEHEYDLIDESRAMEAREQNSLTTGRL